MSARTREAGADADDDVCVRACSGARMHGDDGDDDGGDDGDDGDDDGDGDAREWWLVTGDRRLTTDRLTD